MMNFIGILSYLIISRSKDATVVTRHYDDLVSELTFNETLGEDGHSFSRNNHPLRGNIIIDRNATIYDIYIYSSGHGLLQMFSSEASRPQARP